jgi:hypothetical protein
VFRRQVRSSIIENRLNVQEMQVDKQSFLINVMHFSDKKVLVRSNVSDKDKSKGIIIIIISDSRAPLKTQKSVGGKLLLRRPQMVLKITIRSHNAGGKDRHVIKLSSMFYASQTVRLVSADGPDHRQTVRAVLANSPTTSRDNNGCIPSSHDDPNRYVEAKFIKGT